MFFLLLFRSSRVVSFTKNLQLNVSEPALIVATLVGKIAVFVLCGKILNVSVLISLLKVTKGKYH